MTPSPTATGSLLWSRAAALSTVALLTGVFAHVQAGGLLPGPLVLGALLVSGTVAALPFLRRPGSTPRIVLLLVLGQTVVHGALAGTAGHRGDPTSPTPVPAVPRPVGTSATGHRSGSYFDVAYAAPTGGAGGAHPGLSLPVPVLHAVMDVTAHPMMAIAHLAAAALCGWWLAMGERALWALLDLAERGWVELLAPAMRRWATAARAVAARAQAVRVPRPVRAEIPLAPRLPILDRSVRRRGPPVAA